MKIKYSFFVYALIYTFCILFACQNDLELIDEENKTNNKTDVEKRNEEIGIELKSDKHIEIDDDEIIIKKSIKWADIKEEINGRLKFEEGYSLNKWKLGASGRGKTLREDYVFKKDSIIYAISKKIKNENKKKTNIILNLNGDENIIMPYIRLEVIKGISWKEIKNSEYITKIKAIDGYHMSDWKFEKDIGSPSIKDEYEFISDKDLYVFAIKDEENIIENNNSSYELPVPLNQNIQDNFMIEIVPIENEINGSPINYPLPVFPHNLNQELWWGVFSNETTTKLLPFRICKYELTYRLWKEVYEWAILNGYKFANKGRKRILENSIASNREPVTMISWRDAIIWCNAYTEKVNGNIDECVYLDATNKQALKNANDGSACDSAHIDISKKGIRLPLETEWEYAARFERKKTKNTVQLGKINLTKLDSASGTMLPIATKETVGLIAEMNKELYETTVCQWYFDGISYKRFVPNVYGAMPCATKRANYLGLYDMSGNVAEFCTTLTQEDIFEKDWSEATFCIVRGGYWGAFSYNCTVGRRKCKTTSAATEELGFRICQTR